MPWYRFVILANMKEQFERRAYQYLVLATVLVVAIGTVFYHVVEHFSYVDAYYFSVVTLVTVGYGDFVPVTTLGKLFTTLYLFVGVGIITTFITYTLKRREAKVATRHANRTNKRNSDTK